MSDDPPQQLTAVVLAAGKGTRFGSTLPKVLQPMAGKPILGHVLDALEAAGVQRTVLVIGYGGEQVLEAFPDSESVWQHEQLGSGHALLQARSAFTGGEEVIAINGDMPLVDPATLLELIQLRRETGAAMALVTCDDGNTEGMGRILRDRAGAPLAIIEDKVATSEQRDITEWNVGLYCFEGAWLWPRIASLQPGPVGEIYLTDLFAEAASAGSVAALIVEDGESFAGVNDRVELARTESVLRNRIRRRHLQAGVLLVAADTVVIDSDVQIGRDTTVFPGTVLLGKTSIGVRCEIGPQATIGASIIGDGSTMAAQSVVLRSKVGTGVSIGPAAVVVDADIADGSTLGPSSKQGTSRKDASLPNGSGAGPTEHRGRGAVT